MILKKLWGAHGVRAPFLSLLERTGLTQRRCAVCLAPFAPTASQLVGASKATALPLLVCPHCAQGLGPYGGQVCPLCGAPPATLQNICVPCGACLTSPPPWQALRFYGLYQNTLKEQLLRFKYGEDLTLIPLLGYMLALASAPLLPVDLVVAMPRHERRLRERGFNQVHELARVTAQTHHLPLSPDSLRRTRPTPPQAQLSAKERQQNPQGSFAATGVQGKRVLLLDDIMTTGSTLRHAAAAVCKAGATAVSVAVVAKALFRADPL